MTIGIDASNIRSGGGLNHLKYLVNNLVKKSSIKKIILIQNNSFDFTFDNPKIKLKTPWYSRFTFLSFIFQFIYHDFIFYSNKCNIVFIPGGIYFGRFKPLVSLSQNILPFSIDEINKHQNIFFRIKLNLIRLFQTHTFKKSNGIIYLHENAKNIISKYIKANKDFTIIPHGIKKQKPNSLNKTLKNFLYVSDFHEYKNHKNLIIAFNDLVEKGFEINLTLVGKLKSKIIQNLKMRNIKILDSLDHNSVLNLYRQTDAFIFPSTCENLPIALLEAMSFGLPIISSNVEPMKSILDPINVFLNPLEIDEIRKGIIELLNSKSLDKIKNTNFNRSKKYSWEECSMKTTEYLIYHSKK